ncbi:MAG: lipid II flippase MurJ [Chitinophagaceae bacterium]|jgi:peptidoglycan biosynthesis protein MviN/MurJ (putative lipid II flippase)
MKEASRKTAISLFIFRFFRLLVSVAILSVSARFFGVGLERESWILCLNFVVVLQLALWGPLNETFRAKFIFIKSSEGEDVALQKAASLLWFSIIIMTTVVLVFELIAMPISKLIAPSFSGNDLIALCSLLRYLLWTAIITQCVQLLSSLLNTYNSFYLPEISGFIAAIFNLLIVVLLSGKIGIYSFLVANYVSSFILLIALLYQIRKLNIPLFSQRLSIRWKTVSPFILYALPFFLPYIIGQCNSLIEKSVANYIGRSSVSIIDYAKKISDIVQTVLTSVLATIMVPILSAKFVEGKMNLVAEESKKYIQLILLILSFIIPMMVLCSNALTDILYNKGTIKSEELSQISILIKLYGISLLGIFAYLIFGLILLSINKNKQYAFFGMVAQIIMILVNFLCWKFFGIYTFVIALSVSHFISAGILFFLLPFPKKEIGRSLGKYAGLILIIILAVFYLNKLYLPVNPFLQIIVNIFWVSLLGVVLAVLFKLPEVEQLKSIVKKKSF